MIRELIKETVISESRLELWDPRSGKLVTPLRKSAMKLLQQHPNFVIAVDKGGKHYAGEPGSPAELKFDPASAAWIATSDSVVLPSVRSRVVSDSADESVISTVESELRSSGATERAIEQIADLLRRRRSEIKIGPGNFVSARDKTRWTSRDAQAAKSAIDASQLASRLLTAGWAASTSGWAPSSSRELVIRLK